MGDKMPRWCRFHEKPKPMVDVCGVGVQIVPMGQRGMGGFYKIPCHDLTMDGIEKWECPYRDFFTDEEVAAQEAESEKHVNEFIRKLELTRPLVERIKNQGISSGSTSCPVCRNGFIDWSCAVDYNKHVHMRCSTADCIVFME